MKGNSNIQSINLSTTPLRTPSPDIKFGNSIRPTLYFENIQFAINKLNRNSTPTRSPHISKSQLMATQTKNYSNNQFPKQNNLSVNSHSSNSIHQQLHQYLNCPENCQCEHPNSNHEVIAQLKKMINLLGERVVSSIDYEPENKQNQGTKQSLQERQKMERTLQNELKKMKKQYQLQNQQVYQTNKMLLSQIKSLECKNQTLQRQSEEFKLLVLQKELDESLTTCEQPKKKITQEKLSLSMIRQQYSKSIKTLKDNLRIQINLKLNDYQNQIQQYRTKLDILSDRLKNCQQVNNINIKLHHQNKELIALKNYQNIIQRSQQGVKIQKQNKQNKQKIDGPSALNKTLKSKVYYENLIIQLKQEHTQSLESLSRQSELRTKKLTESYQQQMRKLKKQIKSIEQENINLKDETENYWQQIIKLRNELVQYTKDKTKLQDKINACYNQITQLQNENANQSSCFGKSLVQLVLDDKDIKQYKSFPELLSQELTQQQLKGLDLLKFQNQNLKDQVQNLKQINQQLEQDKDLAVVQLHSIKDEQTKMEQQYRWFVNQEIRNIKNCYQNELSQYQKKNNQLTSQFAKLQKLYNNRQSNFKNSDQNQWKDNERQINNWQLQTKNLQKIDEESEQISLGVSETNKQITSQNDDLSYEVSKLQISSSMNDEKKQKQQDCQTIIKNLQQNYQEQINGLISSLNQKQAKDKEMFFRINYNLSTAKAQNFIKQLQELKCLLHQAKFEGCQTEQSKIIQNFQRSLIRSEEKTMEINNLIYEKNQLREKITQLQKMRLVLQEKVKILSGNTYIIESELKQWKTQCLLQLNKKVLLEKENLTLKKRKQEKKKMETNKNKFTSISMKIDQLLFMENEREKLLMQTNKKHIAETM